MKRRVLHLVDRGTNSDALEMLAHLLGGLRDTSQRVVVLGHRETGELARWAGVPEESLSYVRSLGWADPAGWRGVKKAIGVFQPDIVHCWGVCGVVATQFAGFRGKKVMTVAGALSRAHLRVLRAMERRHACRATSKAMVATSAASETPRTSLETPPSSAGFWRYAATSESLRHLLVRAGLPHDRISVIQPGVSAAEPLTNVAEVKAELGIEPEDGPIILLGGEGRHARHDYGLWASAILQQLYPRTKVVVREETRGGAVGRLDMGTERLAYALPADEMFVIAPRDMSWKRLLQIADLLLVTADGPMPAGSILHAMAAGVVVVGMPVECVTELISDGENGVIARAPTPRAVAARLEEFMGDPAQQGSVGERARVTAQGAYGAGRMIEAYGELYGAAGLSV